MECAQGKESGRRETALSSPPRCNLTPRRRTEQAAVFPAELAIAWLLQQGPDIVPIPGTRRIARLDENAAATRLRLSAAEMLRIDEVLHAFPVAGTRYPRAGMGAVNL